MIYLEKVITSLLSALIFSIIFAISFDYFKIVMTISFFVYLMIGSPISYILDTYIVKALNNRYNINTYILSFVVYPINGMLIISIFALLQNALLELNIHALVIFGMLPALIYFHIGLILKYIFSQIKNA